MKTIVVHHRSPHHARHSGYGRLIDYLENAYEVRGSSWLPYRLAKLIGTWSHQQAGLYNSSSVFKELELYKNLRQGTESTVVHYLNAERDIRHLVKHHKNKQVKFVGTFHKPPHILKQTITDTRYLKHLNGAICVGDNQVDFIKNWLGLEHVMYIPHGVDTQFFLPDITKRTEEPHLLFVGQHLRDFERFNACVPEIIAHLPQTKVTVILKKEFAEKVLPHENIRICHGLHDEALRTEYQKAHILLLPLLEATACNSILEAMACGLPVITSRVGGLESYLEGTGNVLCDNKQEFINCTIALLSDKDQQHKIAEASRLKALTYDWRVVVEQVKQFYNTIL
ncbi:glycosyltransferase family 4 protein [Aestuariibaculum suncheonense]|uniref:Glycosyltransferase family 4 protein n=1 Tax=Aestuariibaculum suncheonense TaxID=1028745 RepID=A0A8J6QIN4_9FLAO|nr:glycosyltransferase family 4 protein [Aestuariibaculum suncheonense]MBD0837033.1 glycosyltransferase family 4 protein [Aestuariibaculum suncheonense]